MGQRLLVVDSDRRFIKEHQVALEAAFDVEFLFGTDGAVSRLDSGEFAAVLLCVEVAENKGYALCSAIKKNPALHDVKVCLISAKATEEEYSRHQTLKGRADLYLHKPIVSSALVSALSPIVPPRAVDPDNPLGDFAGMDLGEEWLESLKAEIDSDALQPAPQAPETEPHYPEAEPLAVLPPLSSAHMVTQRIPVPVPPSPDAGRLMLLEERVKDLEQKLVQQHELLAQKDQELEELHRKEEALAERDRELEELRQEHQVVTRNLDEMERRQAEMDDLQQQLQEAHQERERLQQQLEDVGGQVADHSQRTAELEQERAALEARIEELARQAEELMGARETIARLEEHTRNLDQQLGEAERVREELSAHLSESEEQAKAFDALKDERIGLEATLRGQSRELAEQVHRVEGLARECEELRGQVELHASAVTAKDQEMADKLALIGEMERELGSLRTEMERLQADRTELEEEITRITKDHEQQRYELLSGLDEREAQISRLNQNLDAQQGQLATMEKDKQELEGQLRERMARMDALTQAISDLEIGLKRAAELTRPF